VPSGFATTFQILVGLAESLNLRLKGDDPTFFMMTLYCVKILPSSDQLSTDACEMLTGQRELVVVVGVGVGVEDEDEGLRDPGT